LRNRTIPGSIGEELPLDDGEEVARSEAWVTSLVLPAATETETVPSSSLVLRASEHTPRLSLRCGLPVLSGCFILES
jgi:hypothetical protein